MEGRERSADRLREGAADRLRALPAIDRVAAALDAPHAVGVAAARAAVDAAREALMAGEVSEVDVVADARARLAAAEEASLQRVLNATGVIVHTNLGRAPLPAAARDAVASAAAGYSNLEYSTRRTGSAGRARRTSRACWSS